MGTLDVEQAQISLVAPGSEDPQIGGVAGPSGTGVAGQEPGDRHRLGPLDGIVSEDDGGADGRGHGALSFGQPGPELNRGLKDTL